MNMKDNSILIILGIILLFLIIPKINLPSFILYGGVDLPLNETNISGECWTLGDEKCIKQEVNLLNYTTHNLLICPEGYYVTESICKEAYNLIEEPKINCYYVEEDECKSEEFLLKEGCPSQYYTTESECEESLQTPFHHISLLLKNKFFIIFSIIGIVLLILFLKW